MRARWLSIVYMVVTVTPVWGQAPSQDRFAITAGQVARALSGKGMQTTEEQVSFPARVVATELDPALDIVAVETAGKGQAAQHSRVKMACHVPGKCLPFYVVVSWATTTPLSATAVNKSDFTMPAGTHAVLVMDDARSHIQVSVISLENGMAGHRIRVSSLDHKQFYFGEVVSPILLKGSF